MKILGSGHKEYKTAFLDGRIKQGDPIHVEVDSRNIVSYSAVNHLGLGYPRDTESSWSAESRIKHYNWFSIV